jgi:hypothetical protein
VYTQNDEHHHSPDGRIAIRRSSDRGHTWSDPTLIHDEPGRDATSPSVVNFPESDRVTVFDFSFDLDHPKGRTNPPERREFETYILTSTDGGRTWTEPVSITDDLRCETGRPFGGSTRTANGHMTSFYSHEWEVEVLFSTDGVTWTDNQLVASPPKGRELAEPVPCRVSDEKLLIYGRDNATGDFYAIRSADGGMSWDDPVFFNPTGSTAPKPIWVKRTGANELTAVWGDRDDHYIYTVSMSAQLAWQDPTALVDEPRRRLHEQIGARDHASYWGGDAGDFGYPTFVELGPDESDIFLTFYDESPRPNLWQMYLR